MSAQAKRGWKIGHGAFQSGKGQVRNNISLTQDKSTGTLGPYVLDDVGFLEEPSTWSRSSKFSFPNENKGLTGTLGQVACRHAA